MKSTIRFAMFTQALYLCLFNLLRRNINLWYLNWWCHKYKNQIFIYVHYNTACSLFKLLSLTSRKLYSFRKYCILVKLTQFTYLLLTLFTDTMKFIHDAVGYAVYSTFTNFNVIFSSNSQSYRGRGRQIGILPQAREIWGPDGGEENHRKNEKYDVYIQETIAK